MVCWNRVGSQVCLFDLSFFSVSLLCVCLHCTVSSAYTSVHHLATHMSHLPYNCHLHSKWGRLRHTKVACHIHVSFAPALTETRRSGSLFLFYITQYMHKAWKKHQNTVYGVNINLALKKGLKFYQTRSNAIILHETLTAYCNRKLFGWKLERSYTRVYVSPRPPPKISLKHDWKRELGSENAQRPEAGQVVQQFKGSQSNQPNPNPDHDRMETPVLGNDPRTARGAGKTSRSQEIETRSFHEEAVKHDRTGTPVVCRDTSHVQGARQTCSSDDSKSFNFEDKTKHDRTVTPVVCRDASHAQGASQTRFSHESRNFNVGDETNHDRTRTPLVCRDASYVQDHEQSMLNEVNIDFRIPGLPHSVVKQAENSRELVKKIENHPRRHALQQDLQQNKAYNPFSTTTKKMVQDVGNVELFELIETDPKTQCKECLSYWSERSSQGFTIVSSEILIFINQCSNMIEMKTFVSNGTILQNLSNERTRIFSIQTKLVDLSQ